MSISESRKAGGGKSFLVFSHVWDWRMLVVSGTWGNGVYDEAWEGGRPGAWGFGDGFAIQTYRMYRPKGIPIRAKSTELLRGCLYFIIGCWFQAERTLVL
jgi:hypothetical protein